MLVQNSQPILLTFLVRVCLIHGLLYLRFHKIIIFFIIFFQRFIFFWMHYHLLIQIKFSCFLQFFLIFQKYIMKKNLFFIISKILCNFGYAILAQVLTNFSLHINFFLYLKYNLKVNLLFSLNLLWQKVFLFLFFIPNLCFCHLNFLFQI